ncbi:MAG: hypothetical protein NTY19_24670 [Planctomycetota bacterium]|nr:hypothetical protein [Planctomycetota bacterium]
MSMRQTVTTNSTLADLPLATEYRSDSHDLVHDFYLPCLERNTLDRRAVGYFTSRGLSVAAQGLTIAGPGLTVWRYVNVWRVRFRDKSDRR